MITVLVLRRRSVATLAFAAVLAMSGCSISGQTGSSVTAVPNVAGGAGTPAGTATKSAALVTATTAPAASPAATRRGTVPLGSSSPPPSGSAATRATSGASAGGRATVQVLARDSISRVAAESKPGIVQITNEQQTLQGGTTAIVPAGVGTGFVIDTQGHILTNNHVIANAQKLEVQTTDGRTFPATLVGRDPRSDLAVLQAPGQNLPTVPLGNSNAVAVGQWVVAIGNALALPGGPTVTAGVISALHRTEQEPPQGQRPGPFLFDLIQTGAKINPGNSGGPLLDLQGQVIGINTLGAGQAEPGVQAQGIGFAIAINTAKRIATELIQTGKVIYPFMGIQSATNTPSLAARYGLPAHRGTVVISVLPGSPAATAGIQPKDVITALDGTPITDESDLNRVLTTQLKPGQTVTVTVARGTGTKNLHLTLGTAPQTG